MPIIPEEIDEEHAYKWHVEPHPSKDYDLLCTDDDELAAEAVADVVEQILDELEVGEHRTITITRMSQGKKDGQ